jgi:alkanesulfonate monooxygenase SsuD/methylene tetrahydromethanopterin reductase-like flavin-dependent oxidoreductase (luciferase family)
VNTPEGAPDIRIGVKPGQWGWTFEELVSSWRAAEDAGFDVISCFDHTTSSPAGLAAWDAPSLMIAMAGHTQRVRVALDVVNVSLRHPFLLAGQLAVAQAASGGRVEVGLGAGSYKLARFDHQVLGLPFPSLDERLATLGRCCELLPRLWRGEAVDDDALGLRGAALGPLGIPTPPIIVGGRSRGVMEVAVRYADGWNAVVTSSDEFAALRDQVERTCASHRRARPLRLFAQVFLRDVKHDNARGLVRNLAREGAEGVTFVLVEERGPEAVRALAEAVL